MPVETEVPAYTPIRAARGASLSCKGWQQEAAMRMLMNNLDEEVGERPQNLVFMVVRAKPRATGIAITQSFAL